MYNMNTFTQLEIIFGEKKEEYSVYNDGKNIFCHIPQNADIC